MQSEVIKFNTCNTLQVLGLYWIWSSRPFDPLIILTDWFFIPTHITQEKCRRLRVINILHNVVVNNWKCKKTKKQIDTQFSCQHTHTHIYIGSFDNCKCKKILNVGVNICKCN